MEVSETTERKTENKYQDEQRFLGKECTKIHAHPFILKKVYSQQVGFYFWVDSVFQVSKAKRELKFSQQ